MTGFISSIETLGLLDGPGIRTVIFLLGCGLRCKFCHNPETWNKTSGKEVSVDDIVTLCERYKNYYGSDGGVTFSGGEPILQEGFILECSRLLHKEGINVCINTAGFGKVSDEFLKEIDLVVFDVKALDKGKYKELTGQNIDLSLNFLKQCQKLNKKMWIRQVIIPDYNDTKQYMNELSTFISKLNNVEKVELLPYSTIGVHKYKELNITYPLENVPDMDREKCSKLQDYLLKKLKM